MTAAALDLRIAALDPVEVFRARAEARALLWRVGEIDLCEAVDKLQADAVRDGLVDEIGPDAVQAIMASAFRVAGGRP